MPVTCSVQDRTLTISLSGEIDHHGAKGMIRELDQQIDRNLPNQLILDLSGTTFMDSSGVAVVLRAWRRMGELEGSVQVTGAPPQANRVLRAAGVDRLIAFT